MTTADVIRILEAARADLRAVSLAPLPLEVALATCRTRTTVAAALGWLAAPELSGPADRLRTVHRVNMAGHDLQAALDVAFREVPPGHPLRDVAVALRVIEVGA